MKYKYVFFDFNGTILDDVMLCLNLLNEMLDEQNKKKLSLNEYKNVFTFPVIDYYVKAGLDFNIKSFKELSFEFINKYQPNSLKCSLYPNTIETFKILISKGYKLVCLSASQIDNLIMQLKHFEIYDYFTSILGLSNIYAKSKVEVGLNYIKENNIDPKECIMIGDTLHDAEVSDNMGIDSVLVSFGHQSYDVLKKSNKKILDNTYDLINYLEE